MRNRHSTVQSHHPDVLQVLCWECWPACRSSCDQLLAEGRISHCAGNPRQHQRAALPERAVGGPVPLSESRQRPRPFSSHPLPRRRTKLHRVVPFAGPSDFFHRRSGAQAQLPTQHCVECTAERAGARWGVTVLLRFRRQECRTLRHQRRSLGSTGGRWGGACNLGVCPRGARRRRTPRSRCIGSAGSARQRRAEPFRRAAGYRPLQHRASGVYGRSKRGEGFGGDRLPPAGSSDQRRQTLQERQRRCCRVGECDSRPRNSRVVRKLVAVLVASSIGLRRFARFARLAASIVRPAQDRRWGPAGSL